MRRRVYVVFVLIAWACAGAHAVAQQGARRLSEGVYTAAQAERGQRTYLAYCASCHSDDLGGGGTFRGDAVPGLRREALLDGWPELNAFYEAFRRAMPADDPGSLSPQEYVDILAYLLAENGWRAGAIELKPDAALLKQIGAGRQANRR